MARILTGIQSSGKLHLGNILGAIRPALARSNAQPEPSFFFIADFHSLTSRKDAQALMEDTQNAAAVWLACGLDPTKDVLYRQSRIPEVAELTWYLNCFTPFPMLANAHSFKDKSDNLPSVNAGLFTYPVLMAADILLYDADLVPVGKDQKQHLEMARDIAASFNHQLGETFVLPEASIEERVMIIPGTDGRKMSKSYGNTIDLFLPEKKLRKAIMGIVTASTPLEEPMDWQHCTVFQLYSLLASEDERAKMKANYEAGGFGFGRAKQALYERILEDFAEERARYNELIADPAQLEAIFQAGEERARQVALPVLERVRAKLGFAR